MKERGEGTKCGVECARCTAAAAAVAAVAAGAGRRYKEHYVQRRKTKWERDARRCPDEWGRWGWTGRRPWRRGTMGTRDGGGRTKKEVGAEAETQREAIRGRADASGRREK